MRSPPAISVPFSCTHHVPAPLPTAVSHGMPVTKPQMLGFGVLAQNPPPCLTLSNAQPPRRLYAILPHSPPLSTTAHRRFTRHARNRATNAQFRGFGPKPTLLP